MFLFLVFVLLGGSLLLGYRTQVVVVVVAVDVLIPLLGAPEGAPEAQTQSNQNNQAGGARSPNPEQPKHFVSNAILGCYFYLKF